MTLVLASTHIASPPERVWEVVMDPSRLGEWVTIHRRLDRASDGPPRRGFRMEQHVHILGATFKVKWTLVDCEINHLAIWEGVGPARSHARTEYLLNPDGDGTRFDYTNEFNAPFGSLGAFASRALVGGMPHREADRSLSRLRKLIEKDLADGRG